jgi:hypothetical protein
MQISEEAIEEFVLIYKEEYGEDISRAEASEMAHRLLTLYELLAQPVPGEHNDSPRPTQHDDDRPPIGFRT